MEIERRIRASSLGRGVQSEPFWLKAYQDFLMRSDNIFL